MKTADVKITNALDSAYAVEVLPKVTADWTFRNFYELGLDEDGDSIFAVDNTPAEDTDGYDIEMFPITSIIEPNRPTKGLQRARAGQAFLSSGYGVNDTKFYVADIDDVYKYWTSPVPTASNGTFPNHTDGQTVVRPHIYYDAVNQVNKIVISVENSWASPSSFSVHTVSSVLGGSWTTIATNPTINNATGQIVLYYNGTGWSSTKPADMTATAPVAGIMLKVNSLTSGRKKNGSVQAGTNGGSSHFDLISMECHREVDLTDRVIQTDSDFDTGDASSLLPMGTITSNTGSVTLSNYDGLFNNENPDSPYYKMLLPDVEFNLSYIYNFEGTLESVQGFKMYSEKWNGQRDDSVEVELRDASKYLDVATNPAMWEGLTVSQIAASILDNVGFSNYNIEQLDIVTDFVIPVFWADGVKTAWELLEELSTASQTAIYFDSFGVLQFKTRDTAFSTSAGTNYALSAIDAGGRLANIVELDQNDEYQPNHVTIPYKITKWSEWNNGQPAMQTVWEPDGTVVLRATPLRKTLDTNDSKMWIDAKEAEYWPYSAIVNVGGEIIEYEGKEYVYYDENSVRRSSFVKSHDEFNALKAKTPGSIRYRNFLTGGLKIKTRGMWNSETSTHNFAGANYSVRKVINGNRSTGVRGFYKRLGKSVAEMYGGNRFRDGKDLLIATVGNTTDPSYKVYGTRIKFERNRDYRTQKAGIVIHNSGTNEDGYYINIMPTVRIGANERAARNEVICYSNVGGRRNRVGGKGAEVAIAEDRWYDVDVYYKEVGANHELSVFIDGRKVKTFTISGSDRHDANGKFGVYTLGRTKIALEYLYASKTLDFDPDDDMSFFDISNDGFKGQSWQRNWVLKWGKLVRRKKKRWTKEQAKWNGRFFDDFGPWVHEIREFDAKLDPIPVLHSRLFSTNDYLATTVEYRGNPFEAHWIMANTGRENAVLNGADALLFKAEDQDVDQVLAVMGRPLIAEDDEKVIAKSDKSIKLRGRVEAEIQSDWMQSKEMAQGVGDWIKQHWGDGADEVEVTIFGNPLIELTDVVTIEYPEKDMGPTTHKYFVTGVSNSFDQGLSTRLTLRRKN